MSIPDDVRSTIETALFESRETRGAMTADEWGRWQDECDKAIEWLTAQPATDAAGVQAYSHRNGETEPPTVDGPYFFDGMYDAFGDGEENLAIWDTVRDMVWVMRGAVSIQEWSGSFDETTGKWYGPITAPWDAPAPATATDAH